MKAIVSITLSGLLHASAVLASSIWGGAQYTGTGIFNVTGVVNVPTASIPPGGNSSTRWGGAAWAGIDGQGSCNGLLQAGIIWNIINGVPKYSAWYEWYPDQGLNYINGLTISPGDKVSIKVLAYSSSSGYICVNNLSTGYYYDRNFTGFTDHQLCQKYGEWIVEDFSVNGSPVNFAKFTPVNFTSCSLKDSTGTHDLTGVGTFNLMRNGVTYASCSKSDSSSMECDYGN